MLVDVKRLKYFADFARAVELPLFNFLRPLVWRVPLFALCCSVGRRKFCLCDVPARSVEMDPRRIHSHRSSGHGTSVFSLF